MRYLIDGHNLIGKIKDISLTDPDDEVKLILRLKSWAAASSKRKVTVIFDGGLPGGISRRLSTSNIQVIFAPEGSTADALLIRRIKQAQNPPEYTLVSSDEQIIAAAAARKMKVWRSEKMAPALTPERPSSQPSSSERDDPTLSQEEVAEWLALFGPVPEPKSTPPKKKRPSPSSKTSQASKKQGKLRIDKQGEDVLSPEDVETWLNLFGPDK